MQSVDEEHGAGADCSPPRVGAARRAIGAQPQGRRRRNECSAFVQCSDVDPIAPAGGLEAAPGDVAGGREPVVERRDTDGWKTRFIYAALHFVP